MEDEYPNVTNNETVRRIQTGSVDPGPYGWVIGALLLLFMMLNFADKTVLGLSASSIMRDLHISPVQFGMISSAFFRTRRRSRSRLSWNSRTCPYVFC